MVSTASGNDVLPALPQMAENDFIPETTGMMIDSGGQLIPKRCQDQQIVTFNYRTRRISARISGGSKDPIRMELGCRLQRLPYSEEGLKKHLDLRWKIYRARSLQLGEIAVTHHRWLYLRDNLRLPPSSITARWLVTQLTLGALMFKPVIELFVKPETEPTR